MFPKYLKPQLAQSPIEINCHFIREKIVFRDIKTEFLNSNDQLECIFGKSLWDPKIDYICNTHDTFYLYAPA